MRAYLNALRDVYENGVDIKNSRTGYTCRTLPGIQVKVDLEDGFPVLTTRRYPFKSVVGELLGFFRGYDNAKDFRSIGCGFWDGNANDAKEWLENPYRKGKDDLGRIYGKQWTSWKTYREVDNYSIADYLLKKGWTITPYDDKYLATKTINQLENAVKTILTDPSDRRIIVEGWNVGELDMMALVPCHKTYIFLPVEETKEMHLIMNIRSWDMFLGSPANIISGSIFLEVMSRLTGYTAKTVTVQAANAHIYENHFEQTEELLSREPLSPPKLVVSDELKEVSVGEVSGVFDRIEPSWFSLEGYEFLPGIKAKMAAGKGKDD